MASFPVCRSDFRDPASVVKADSRRSVYVSDDIVGNKVSHRKQIARQHLCHTKIGQGEGVVNPVKFPPSSRLIAMQDLVIVCHTVWSR